MGSQSSHWDMKFSKHKAAMSAGNIQARGAI